MLLVVTSPLPMSSASAQQMESIILKRCILSS